MHTRCLMSDIHLCSVPSDHEGATPEPGEAPSFGIVGDEERLLRKFEALMLHLNHLIGWAGSHINQESTFHRAVAQGVGQRLECHHDRRQGTLKAQLILKTRGLRSV